tara:strand:- start:21 stop:533 length:513 start_codon:yes stop_codon:yes gene_type:complete
MKKAVCVLTNNHPSISGYVEFNETKSGNIDITLNIKGLSPGLHGFHIHKTGDLRKGCNSLCSHFNPYNTLHGDISSNKNNRHIGDLGNILVQTSGVANYTFTDKLIKLNGKRNIIGRSVVIHDLEDDLGVGGLDVQHNDYIIVNEKVYNESVKTGNAGERIACGVIGWAE